MLLAVSVNVAAVVAAAVDVAANTATIITPVVAISCDH